MDKLKMQSENLVDENVEKIAKLFPNCVTEGKDENGQVTKLVDFDLLKQELSKVVVDGNDERYTLNWAGKKQAILTANSPINATLRPCREESVDFDNTKNLYIEGDNLDVLKLLRETYLNKIKMIYIDPPYNTGNDFVYNDDFATSSDEYLQNSKSYDEEGNRMVQNLESNGRFHSDWLSMMYPRLKLARDLLTDDGVIFISIDDNEQANLKKICDEVFGEHNFITQFIWKKTENIKMDSKFVSVNKEYVLCYRKCKIEEFYKDFSTEERFNLEDEKGKYYLRKLDSRSSSYSKGMDYIIEHNGVKYYAGGSFEDYLKRQAGEYGKKDCTWLWSKEKLQWGIDNNEIVFKNGNVYNKVRYDGLAKKPFTDIINCESGQTSQKELDQLLGERLFDHPKPVSLIKYLMRLILNKGDIVLDFFSGSATTAHATMEFASENYNINYILVQLPEKLFSKKYKTICEIGKERIRRAGKKIVEEITNASITFGKNRKNVKEMSVEEKKIFDMAINMASEKLKNEDGLQNLENFIKQADKIIPDIGFRVLKLDSSNMKDIYYNPADIKQDLLSQFESNIKEDRSSEDLLFQVMLDMGVILSSEIKTLDIKGKKVFNVNDGNLVCCFDENLTDEVVTEIAKMQPLYAVFRDSSMSSDSVAVNFDQIFETYSPSTTRKVL